MTATDTNPDLASHVETVLGGKKVPNAFEAVRSTILSIEDARTDKKRISEFRAFLDGEHSKLRIKLVARAFGSVLAGQDPKFNSTKEAHGVVYRLDREDADQLGDLIATEIDSGREHPWRRDENSAAQPGRPTRDTGNHDLPNHNGSFHFLVLRALDEVKLGKAQALYSDDVLRHMSNLSAEEIASDAEIAKIKSEMKAAKLSVSKWEAAISGYRLKNLNSQCLYPDMRRGGPDPKSRRNVQVFLDAAHANVWYDEFSNKAFIDFEDRCTSLNDASLLEWVFRMRESGLPIDKDAANDALSNLAHQNNRHPVKEYLGSLKWDGKPRVDTWLATYAGSKDTELNRAYGRKFLIGAVRRINEPGLKLRAMPILEGEQNIGKSLIFRTIAVRAEWYTDSLELGCDPKEVIELTEGKWIVETPELSGMAKRDVEHVKAMVSRDVDKARLAYGRFSTEVPRQFVLGGTTNTDEYLKDRTGNTRFWGIKVGKPNIQALERDRDQLWAEAVQIEAANEPHWLNTPELLALAQKSVQRREERSPIEQQWIDLMKRAKSEGDIFIPTEELYRAGGLEDTPKRLQSHKASMAFAAKRAGWVPARKRSGDERPYGFVPEGVEPQSARTATFDRLLKRIKASSKPRSRTSGAR